MGAPASSRDPAPRATRAPRRRRARSDEDGARRPGWPSRHPYLSVALLAMSGLVLSVIDALRGVRRRAPHD
jgi:hypothetical protein